MIIYLAQNIINGKPYIGQTTKTLHTRKLNHYSYSKKSNTRFANALRKYDKDDFNWMTLTECANIDELNLYEELYIKLFSSTDEGYNLQYGGKNQKHTEESKHKISESNIGKHSLTWLGKKHTQESKDKISKSHLGKTISTEQLQKMLDGRKDKPAYNKGKKGLYVATDEVREKLRLLWLGKNHTEETKRKISESAKQRWAKLKSVS